MTAFAQASVYVERATAKVQPSSPVGSARKASIKAAKNEFEAFQVVVHADGGNVDGVTATASALSGPAHSSIPAGNISLYREELMNITTPSGNIGQAGMWPDALVPAVDEIDGQQRNAFPFSVPANESRAIWVDVQVPAKATPGMYRGTIDVSGTGFDVKVPVELEVWNFQLPSTPTLSTAFRAFIGNICLAQTGSADCNGNPADMATKYERMALDHRITLSNVFVVRPNGGDWSAFDQTFGPFLDGTADTRLPGAKMTAAEYTWQRDVATERDFAQHFRQKGWFGRVFDYAADEPPYGSSWGDIASHAAVDKAADPDFKVLVTTNKDLADQNGVTDKIDTLVPIVNDMDSTVAPYQGDQRPKYDNWLNGSRSIWMYQSCMSHGCSFGGAEPGATWPSYMIDVPATRNRIMQWADFEARVTGELYYETAMVFDRDPWSSVFEFNGNGDGTLFYPGTPAKIGGTSSVPVASIRLKMIREGVEDFEYLAAVARLGDPNYAHQMAQKVLPALYQSGNDNPAVLEQVREQLASRILKMGGSRSTGENGQCLPGFCGDAAHVGCSMAGGAAMPLLGALLALGIGFRRRRSR